MDGAGTVVGVVFVFFIVIIISTLAAVYLVWKDGCCKRREEGDAERGGENETEQRNGGRPPSRSATHQNSSLFSYLTRFTDSGRYRNMQVSAPPPPSARNVNATTPTYENKDFEPENGQKELTAGYNQMAPVAYEVPVERPDTTTSSGYEIVQHGRLTVPQTGLTDSFENSGRYDYIASDSIQCSVDAHGYEVSTSHVGGEKPSGVPIPSRNKPDVPRKAATPPSQHYDISYATPIITPSKNNIMEVSSGERIYCAPATDERSLYAQFKDFKIRLIPRRDIRITGFLGQGQFGKVQKGEWQSSGGRGTITVAIKLLKENSGEEDKVKFLQEVAIVGQFSHPNVIKLHGIVSTDTPLMMLLELLPKGDLRNHLISLRKTASKQADSDLPSTLLGYCRDVAQGMNYLAKKAFIHRDLAARNILLSEDGVCKVADFGLSRELTEADYYVSSGGQIPVKWTAPDALHFRKYSTASDVWSFGCVMYEIWSLGHKPFEDCSNLQALKMVDSGYRLPPPPGCTKPLYSIMINCWNPQPQDRPTFDRICQQLGDSDSDLLKWSVRERVDAPDAIKLGANLKLGAALHKDLQKVYQT